MILILEIYINILGSAIKKQIEQSLALKYSFTAIKRDNQCDSRVIDALAPQRVYP